MEAVVGAAAGSAGPAELVQSEKSSSGSNDAKYALKKFIANFAVTASSPKPKDLEAARDRLGKAPPCESYRSLITLAEFEPMANGILFVETPAGIKATNRKQTSTILCSGSACKATFFRRNVVGNALLNPRTDIILGHAFTLS